MDQTLGEEKMGIWGEDVGLRSCKKGGGGGETPGIHTGLANPLARFANSSFSLESGGTAKPCSHTVHWFPAGCALCREWPGGPEPGAGVLPPLPSAPHCVGLGVGS